MPGSYSFIDTLLPLTQERFFGDINSNGNIALPFNETQLVQAVVVLAVLVVVAIILSQLGLFSIPEFFANKSQKRFDHMRPEHQGFRPEHPKMESRYRRDLTGKFILQFFFLFFFKWLDRNLFFLEINSIWHNPFKLKSDWDSGGRQSFFVCVSTFFSGFE